jgi:hypothetical protein
MSHRFIIGIGSQRAASTLLHRLIGESSDVFMHPVKELHYFDTLFGVRSQEALTDFSLRQLGREVERIVSATDYKFIGRRYKCFLRSTKILATQPVEKIDYLDLYRPFLKERPLLGEVTPEYMLFDEEQVARMRAVVGQDASIILMCRNPVDRVLSAAKLFNTYNNLRMDDIQLGAWLQRMIDENSSWIQAQDRYNDYERAIRVYGTAFPRFLALSYERLIESPDEAAKRIAEVCGTPVDQHKFREGLATVSNSLGDRSAPDTAVTALLSQRYENPTQFLRRHFGSRQP